MPHGRDATDGKPCLSAHLRGVSTAKLLACNSLRLGGVDKIAPGGDEHHKPGVACKDDRLSNLVDVAGCRVGGLLRGAGFGGHFLGRDVQPMGKKGVGDAAQGFGHVAT